MASTKDRSANVERVGGSVTARHDLPRSSDAYAPSSIVSSLISTTTWPPGATETVVREPGQFADAGRGTATHPVATALLLGNGPIGTLGHLGPTPARPRERK